MSIRLDVKLLFELSGYAPQKAMPFSMHLKENSTVKNLLHELQIPLSPDLVTLVDGVPSGLADALPHKGRVTIFPTVMGG